MGYAYQIRDQFAPYFLTFQVVGWVDVFSRKSYRDIVIESFKYCRENKALKIMAYVIMTNHVHVILQSKTGTLSNVVRDLKRYTSNQILKQCEENFESRKDWMNLVFQYHARNNKRVKTKQFWTHENHAVELYDNKIFESKMEYIHDNPVRAGWVENQEDYIYSSARNYSGLFSLLEIDMI